MREARCPCRPGGPVRVAASCLRPQAGRSRRCVAKVAAHNRESSHVNEVSFATFRPTRRRDLPGGGTPPGKPEAVQWSRASAPAPAAIPLGRQPRSRGRNGNGGICQPNRRPPRALDARRCSEGGSLAQLAKKKLKFFCHRMSGGAYRYVADPIKQGVWCVYEAFWPPCKFFLRTPLALRAQFMV